MACGHEKVILIDRDLHLFTTYFVQGKTMMEVNKIPPWGR